MESIIVQWSPSPCVCVCVTLMGGPRAEEGGPCSPILVPHPRPQSVAQSRCWPGLQFHEEGPPSCGFAGWLPPGKGRSGRRG